MKKEKLVIIPTFNESENIEDIIHAVMALEGDFELLIIDDNSPDGTSLQVKSLQKKYPDRLHLIVRTGKNGLGTAYLEGFHYAMRDRKSVV